MLCWNCLTGWKRARPRRPLADIVDPAKRSEMMAGIGAKNTKPELLVRRILHRLGYRFRLHRKDLPGKPDIVLPKWRTVVFVHGCFWHGHVDCPIFRLPKSRTEFWSKKIEANRRRDDLVQKAYTKLDWRVSVVWECALKGKSRIDPETIGRILADFLEKSEVERLELRGKCSCQPL